MLLYYVGKRLRDITNHFAEAGWTHACRRACDSFLRRSRLSRVPRRAEYKPEPEPCLEAILSEPSSLQQQTLSGVCFIMQQTRDTGPDDG